MIYRVEHPCGKGPYQTIVDGKYIACCKKDHYDEIQHPDPYYDIPGWAKLPNKSQYVFGFTSLTQLYKWFEGLEHIWEHCSIRVYDCEPVLASERQCVFKK